MIQFVYPNEELPLSYKEAIDSIDHNSIVSSSCKDKNLVAEAEIVIFDEWTGLDNFTFNMEQAYVLRTSKDDFLTDLKVDNLSAWVAKMPASPEKEVISTLLSKQENVLQDLKAVNSANMQWGHH